MAAMFPPPPQDPAAVLRRAVPKDPTVAQKELDAKALERGLLRMDPERHTCTWKNEPVTLTVTSPGGQPRQVPVTLGSERSG